MLLHRKKYIQNKYIFFFFLFFFLFFQRFRRFSCILKVLYLYETNKYFKNSVFTPHNQLYICFHSKKKKKGFTLPKKKKKKNLKEEGVLLYLFSHYSIHLNTVFSL
jgi:hypothetical protein